MAADSFPACGPGCITCSDEGTPMRVIELDAALELAQCEGEGGERSTVEVALVAPVEVGDALLVHAGTALARLDGDSG